MRRFRPKSHHFRVTIILIGAPLLLFACKDNNNVKLIDNGDLTPIANEELSDLEPGRTLNDLRSVREVIGGETEYDTFLKALYSAQIEDVSESDTQITVVAPISFNRLTDSKFAHLETPSSRAEFQYILPYRIVEDGHDMLKSNIRLNENVFRLKFLNGRYISVSIDNDAIFITDENAFHSKISRSD